MRVKSATVLLFNPVGHVLAISRGRDTMDWGMPGGDIEPGEAPVEAAARELYEETGLVVPEHWLRSVYVQAGCETFVVFDGPPTPTRQPMSSVPFEGYVAWLPPEMLTLPSATFGELTRRLFYDLGVL